MGTWIGNIRVGVIVIAAVALSLLATTAGAAAGAGPPALRTTAAAGQGTWSVVVVLRKATVKKPAAKPKAGKHGKHGTGALAKLSAAKRKEIRACITAAKGSRTARAACFKKYVGSAK
jgi:hypothetical protein